MINTLPIAASISGSLFSLDTVYVLTGVVLLLFAAMTVRDRANPRRLGTATFWVTLGVIFAAGSLMPHWLTGLMVLGMVALDGVGSVSRGSYNETTKAEQAKEADRLRDRIFLPVLVIPIVTFGFAVAFRLLGLDVNKGALMGLGFGGIAAMIVGLALTKGNARAMMDEGRRRGTCVGWRPSRGRSSCTS